MEIILLDIGNVLVRVDFMSFSRAVAVPREGAAEAVLAKYCSGDLKARFDTGRIDAGAFLALLSADPLVRRLPAGELALAWQRIFKPLPGAAEGVAALAKRSRIWIMSDTDPLHFAALMERVPPLRDRERYCLSFRHGFLKSSPEAFRHVLQDSVLDPACCTLVDDRAENCRAAGEAGIRSHCFTSWPEALRALDGGAG
ncbi:HAD-IA family hydrolase [Chlorobium sp. N1]|uniref:HAD-IA family hydrolase n=1 Tax=Chlorobium sp. N1 TaxID=2491138 RepID=UPI0010405972|nr:HAD-IA family hydrolase [Chlorobium sp. N1]TCD47824.1 haloacid dehalogenase [Chlorobium sp. N1]